MDQLYWKTVVSLSELFDKSNSIPTIQSIGEVIQLKVRNFEQSEYVTLLPVCAFLFF